MNELKVFKNSEFGQLDILIVDGIEMFPATECAEVLGYTNSHDAISRHCKLDGVVKHEVIDSMGRTQEKNFINEGNLYRLIIRSKLPAAEKFESWVFDEVLPSIRKTGKYSLNKENICLKERLKIASILKSTPKARMPAIYKILEPYIGEMPIDVPANNSAAEQEKRLRMAVYELVCDEKYILKKLDKNRVAIDRNEIKKVAFDIGITYMAAMKILDEFGLIQRDAQGKRTANLYINGTGQRLVVFFVNKVLKTN